MIQQIVPFWRCVAEPTLSLPSPWEALALIQEAPRCRAHADGTAHALDSRAFPIPVMGKTGTTNDFRDALFVGSTYGAGGVTVAVRIGFDDGRSLGSKETGGRVALPVFQEVMLRMYRDKIAGPAPAFPPQMEQRITRYLEGAAPAPADDGAPSPALGGAVVGKAMQQDDTLDVTIGDNTGSIGTTADNLALGTRRADVASRPIPSRQRAAAAAESHETHRNRR
jgi:membrane carboxypeptidase/penicillin-binding protein